MKNKIIITVIFIVICIVIYIVIYSYTTQINVKNKNNTYESTSMYENYRVDYVNKYIETLKNNNYEVGFNMLDDSTKKSFNNNLKQYSEYITNLTRNMNKTDNGITINLINDLFMKNCNIIEYEIISKDCEYIKDNEVYFSEQYTLFSEFKLIEYSPNVFKIYIK
ncbi:MAG: hypothetical protein PHD15_01170 [Clostridia bacterium]|nr:hypothetical protein [Clostridia bacterium]MDD4386360.1 hypothetical protein [Clostridia bacterium]